MRFRRLLFAFGLLGLALTGPAGGEAPPATGKAARQPLSAAQLKAAVAPDGALQSVIESLETSIPRGECGEFDAFVEAEWLLDAIIRPVNEQQGIHLPEIEAALVKGPWASWANLSLSNGYLGHQFRFLRVQTLGGRPGLLFRSAGDPGQLNYCLFAVAARPDGTLRAEDIYVVGTGEWLSDTLRRAYLTLVESLNPRGESGRRASLYVEALPQITAMQTALIRSNYSEALAFSSALPAEVLQDRQVLLTRLEAAEHLSLEDRRRTFTEWKALHPNPQLLPLKWADFHLAIGDFDEARSVLTTLNRRLGGDSYLMVRLGEIKMLASYHAAGRLLGGYPGQQGSPAEHAERQP